MPTSRREFANTDRHATNTLVTNAEDRFVVGYYHQFDITEWRRIPQYLLDAASVIRRDEHAAGTTKDMRVKMRSRANRRRVNDGHQFLEVRAEYLVEQYLITVLQQPEVDIPAHGIRIETDRVIGPVRLRHDIVMLRWQHALDPESTPLIDGEADALVVNGRSQQIGAAQVRPYLVAFGSLDQFELFHATACHPCG